MNDSMEGRRMTVELFHDQSPRKYGTGLGSNSRPLDLQSDSHLLLHSFNSRGVEIANLILTQGQVNDNTVLVQRTFYLSKRTDVAQKK